MVEGQGDGFPGTGRRFIIGLDSPHRLNRLAEGIETAAGAPQWRQLVGQGRIDQAAVWQEEQQLATQFLQAAPLLSEASAALCQGPTSAL